MNLGDLRKALRALANEYGDETEVGIGHKEIYTITLPGISGPPNPDKLTLRKFNWIVDGSAWTLQDRS